LVFHKLRILPHVPLAQLVCSTVFSYNALGSIVVVLEPVHIKISGLILVVPTEESEAITSPQAKLKRERGTDVHEALTV
jgi:hypothetical protein